MNLSTSGTAQLPVPSIHAKAFVDPTAVLGPGCVIRAGAYIGAGVQLGEGVEVGVNAVLVDAVAAPEPGADGLGQPSGKPAGTLVQAGVRIGANASVHAGLVIAARAELRPGAVVTRSVPPNAIVEGNPAYIVGYVNTALEPHPGLGHSHGGASKAAESAVERTVVSGVTVHHFPVISDLRGDLTVGEFDKQIPFAPKRYFMVFGVPNREIRGEHAHRRCHQFLICLRGSCAVVADDGTRRVEIELDAPNRGLYLPPMTWGIQYKYSPEALLLVFASDYYDAGDYIRDYAQFNAEVSARAAA
jgi:UDP-2-acetamido-3-amino-2,3-dideoxy-glucuronate N-acetyltransferase